MLYEQRGNRPIVDSAAAIAPNAAFCGDVRIGPRYAVAFGAVLSAEDASITFD